MSNLPSRYEIRQLGPEHSQWASAIVAHSNIFYSSVFSVVYPEGQTARFNACVKSCDYLVDHQINSGLSYGVFDTEYRYKRPQSAATSGKFYWDPENDSLTGDELLEAMDFPLVSVALAYDGMDPLDMNRLAPIIACLPVFATVYVTLEKLDPRPPESWRFPKTRNVLLMRNATSTRREYEGEGLMSTLARHLMRTAAAKGFKMANIECLSDRVTHVWANPPSPFRGEIVASFQAEDYEETDEKGNVVKPFSPAKQLITRRKFWHGRGGFHDEVHEMNEKLKFDYSGQGISYVRKVDTRLNIKVFRDMLPYIAKAGIASVPERRRHSTSKAATAGGL